MSDATLDAHTTQLMRDIEQGLQEAHAGVYARVTTPTHILARRAGRPVGSVKAAPKVQTAIRFDADVIAALKATGRGWQTRVNDTMRDWLRTQTPV
jgi:uncharacterized protein (DUF4415 family)